MVHLPLLPLNVHAAAGDWLTEVLQSNLFNVVLAIGILGWVLAKLNLGQVLTQRQSSLAASVQQTEQQKQQLQKELQQLKQRTELLHREIDTILSEARASADVISTQIIDQARQDALRIQHQALAQQKQLLLQTEQQIQQTVMRDVLNAVEDQLKQGTQHNISYGGPDTAIDAFIDRLPQLTQKVG
jgi:F0F1-type ATP synthase membrane subunit b/b'